MPSRGLVQRCDPVRPATASGTARRRRAGSGSLRRDDLDFAGQPRCGAAAGVGGADCSTFPCCFP